jgi:hypothetical protein
MQNLCNVLQNINNIGIENIVLFFSQSKYVNDKINITVLDSIQIDEASI